MLTAFEPPAIAPPLVLVRFVCNPDAKPIQTDSAIPARIVMGSRVEVMDEPH